MKNKRLKTHTHFMGNKAMKIPKRFKTQAPNGWQMSRLKTHAPLVG